LTARVLDNDLAVLVRAVEFASEPDRERLLELAAGYLSSVDDSVFRETEALAADSGGYAQRMLQEWYGSNVAGGRIDDLVVFDSHGGKQYSCNPRAIYEELRRRDTGLQCVWITRDGQFAVPDGGRVVVHASREHYELATRARILVSNMLQPDWYRRPAGQLYLQTWHGTPLKRICLDVERPQFLNGMAYHDRVRKDVANWDALLSANTFSTPIFRRPSASMATSWNMATRETICSAARTAPGGRPASVAGSACGRTSASCCTPPRGETTRPPGPPVMASRATWTSTPSPGPSAPITSCSCARTR
jgi:CDP-Glycerol:Poly(glycerophosphate) glycerophosphotransferase